MKNRRSIIDIGILSVSLYISFQIFADILSIKITTLPFLHLAIDGGTVIYPFTFTLRDFVHKTWGKERSRQVVITAGILNLLMAVLFWLIGKMPADPTWNLQGAYESILMPFWRITIASMIAEVFSELIDTEVFDRVYRKFGDIKAVLFSNGVALVIDSFIFSFIAFAGVLPLVTVLSITLSNIIVKMAVTLISLPTIKLVPRRDEYFKG